MIHPSLNSTPLLGSKFSLGNAHHQKLHFFPGQERTQGVKKMYFQDSNGCVLMLDVTLLKALDEAHKWKFEFDSSCKPCVKQTYIPCVLIAHKVRQLKRRYQNKFSLTSKLDIVDFISSV